MPKNKSFFNLHFILLKVSGKLPYSHNRQKSLYNSWNIDHSAIHNLVECLKKMKLLVQSKAILFTVRTFDGSSIRLCHN